VLHIVRGANRPRDGVKQTSQMNGFQVLIGTVSLLSFIHPDGSRPWRLNHESAPCVSVLALLVLRPTIALAPSEGGVSHLFRILKSGSNRSSDRCDRRRDPRDLHEVDP
jgi:hypothetical protein